MLVELAQEVGERLNAEQFAARARISALIKILEQFGGIVVEQLARKSTRTIAVVLRSIAIRS